MLFGGQLLALRRDAVTLLGQLVDPDPDSNFTAPQGHTGLRNRVILIQHQAGCFLLGLSTIKNVAVWSSDTSFMVAILPPTLVSEIIEQLHGSLGNALKAADESMYVAKNAGKDRPATRNDE